jgi:uncharacterized protein
MTGADGLNSIKDSESLNNIREMARCFVSQVNPLKVILFGSFAEGTYTDESDFDFYLVIENGRSISEALDRAYSSVLYVKKRPVDIVIGTKDYFERRTKAKNTFMIEGEVQKKGILIYDQVSDK